MAFSFDNKNSKKRRIISEINVTPFVDVLLVLLIIFMVAAPMMTSAVKLELPKGSQDPNQEKNQPITISITSSGSIYLQDEEVKMSSLPSKLLKITNNNLGTKIHVRGDKNLDYGKVMNLVSVISSSGFKKVVLVTKI